MIDLRPSQCCGDTAADAAALTPTRSAASMDEKATEIASQLMSALASDVPIARYKEAIQCAIMEGMQWALSQRDEVVLPAPAPDQEPAASKLLPKHQPTECCGFEAFGELPYPVMWNDGNKVVQCHHCGLEWQPKQRRS